MRDDIKINDRAFGLARPNYRKTRESFLIQMELDVYNLGLIYEINLDETGSARLS